MTPERLARAEAIALCVQRYWRAFALALLLVVAGCVAMADVPSRSLDTFHLTQIDDYTAELVYHNSASMSSVSHPLYLPGKDFTVSLQLEITGGDEILTAYPSEGWIAIPETVSVADGDTGIIKIIKLVGF